MAALALQNGTRESISAANLDRNPLRYSSKSLDWLGETCERTSSKDRPKATNRRTKVVDVRIAPFSFGLTT